MKTLGGIGYVTLSHYLQGFKYPNWTFWFLSTVWLSCLSGFPASIPEKNTSELPATLSTWPSRAHRGQHIPTLGGEAKGSERWCGRQKVSMDLVYVGGILSGNGYSGWFGFLWETQGETKGGVKLWPRIHHEVLGQLSQLDSRNIFCWSQLGWTHGSDRNDR